MLALMFCLAIAASVEIERPSATTDQIAFFRQSSKEKLEADLRDLTVGVSRCSDIESHLASHSIQYRVWDHGADGDGTHRYTIVQRRPKDNSPWDNFLDRDLYGTIEVVNCVMTSKKIEYTYSFL